MIMPSFCPAARRVFHRLAGAALVPVGVILAGVVATTDAQAQIQLPGAIGGGGASSSAQPPGPTPVNVRAPTDASLIGRELRLNGARGRMVFQKRGADLVIARLTFGGELISRRDAACEVNVEEGPFLARPDGRREGLRRYRVDLPACMFTFEILDQAIHASVGEARASSPIAGVCTFERADCRAYVAGMWGPAGDAIGTAEVRQIEQTRVAAEKNALANYRALMAAAGRDRDAVRALAADQASFSSRRAEACFDYLREDFHGFCASRFTQARAIALRAQTNPAAFEAADNAPERRPAVAPPSPRTQPPAHQQGGSPPGAPMSLGR
jgi:hypothetical protein